MNEQLSYEQFLNQRGVLTYSNKGVSMLPLLREGKDLFTIAQKGKERCKVGDVVLYRRFDKQYVLHRIIKVRQEDYVILGDNCIQKEYNVKDEDILGIMISFVRGGKEHHVTERGYRLYSFLIIHTVSIRIFLKLLFIWAKSFVMRGRK